MGHHVILKIIAKFLIPYILTFSLYVQFLGEYGPGGGFQAGLIFAAGIIIYALIYGTEAAQKIIPMEWIEKLMPVGALIFIGTGYVCMAFGGNFLDYDYLIFLNDSALAQTCGIITVELGVGITVTATMLIIFYTFTEQEP